MVGANPSPRIPDRPRSSNNLTNQEPKIPDRPHNTATSQGPHIPDRPSSRPSRSKVAVEQTTESATSSETESQPKIPSRPATPRVPSRPESRPHESEEDSFKKEEPGIPLRPASRPSRGSHHGMHVHVSPNAIAIDPPSHGEQGLTHQVPTFHEAEQKAENKMNLSLGNASEITNIDESLNASVGKEDYAAEVTEQSPNLGATEVVIGDDSADAGSVEPSATPSDPIEIKEEEEKEKPVPVRTDSIANSDILDNLIDSYAKGEEDETNLDTVVEQESAGSDESVEKKSQEESVSEEQKPRSTDDVETKSEVNSNEPDNKSQIEPIPEVKSVKPESESKAQSTTEYTPISAAGTSRNLNSSFLPD